MHYAAGSRHCSSTVTDTCHMDAARLGNMTGCDAAGRRVLPLQQRVGLPGGRGCELGPFTNACQPAAGGSLATLAGGTALAAQVRTLLCFPHAAQHSPRA